MKKYFLLFFCTISLFNILKAATDTTVYYLNEGFESPESQSRWISQPVHPTIKWEFQEGGHDLNPITAKQGEENAIFYWSDPIVKPTRTLVSSPIDLSTASKPQLTFWHAMYTSVFGTDELYLVFKAGSKANWDTVASYVNQVPGWTRRIFNIDEIDSKYLVDSFYVGFRGTAKGGHGVCIDSVVIEEMDEISRFVKSLSLNQVQHNVVPSGVSDFPFTRLNINVAGNSGSIQLNSITFDSESDDDTDFSTNGFKLFLTYMPVFMNELNGTSNQVGSSVSISGDKVTFSSINQILKTGDNYFWLVGAVRSGAKHNDKIKFRIEGNDINITDTLLPATTLSTGQSLTIGESVYFQDFEGAVDWSIGGDFEIDAPMGLDAGNTEDPDFAYQGTNILGTDLTDDGAYLTDIDSMSAYYAETPLINLRYYDNVKLFADKWIAFFSNDYASIDVTSDNGTSWEPIWTSPEDGLAPESEWNELYLTSETDELLSRKDSVKIRFTIKKSGSIITYAGWNIDNFAIIGNHLENDVGIVRILSPYDDCYECGNDTVRVIVKNFAEEPTNDSLPIFFSLNGYGGPRIYDTIFQSIPKDDSLIFTFSSLAGFPEAGPYNHFFISMDVPGDEDHTNDSLTVPLFIPENIVPPDTVDFEINDGMWKASDGSTWLCILPDASIGPTEPGSDAWLVSPFGDYQFNDTSYITSSCYNLTNEERHIVELDYWMMTEEGDDGFNLEYSVDDGENWNLIDTSQFGREWGWYTDIVSTLGEIGWSGNEQVWKTAKELLPASLSTESKVRFRIKWGSDGDENYRGIAIDNFRVFPAPDDIGVSSIIAPVDSCQFSNSDLVSVSVKNYGYNKLDANDTIILGMNFETEAAVIDTFILASDLFPGDSVSHTLTTPIDITIPGMYSIYSYTLIEEDPWYFNENNDTTWYDFTIWQNPITLLPDTIQSKEPDTVILRPYYDPNYDYYWWHDGSTDSIFDVPTDGVYKLTVTENTHGCSTTDSVYVEFLFNDVGIDSILWPVSSCELGSAEYVQVQVHNFGTDSITTGDKIRVVFEFEGGPPVLDTITLLNSFYAGEDLWYTFDKGPIDVSSVGNYDIKAYSDYGGDTIVFNDTVESEITVYGYPTVDIGPDTTVNGLSYTIDAGAGFVTYNWNDGDSVQVKDITQSGEYSIHVFDNNGCDARDTAYIYLKIRDIYARAMLNPVNECERQGTDQVQLRLMNNGTDTIRTTDNINVKYNINGGGFVSAVVPLISDLLPGDSIDYTFSNQEDLTGIGTYNFILVGTTPGDLRTWNDSIIQAIDNSEIPDIDFNVPSDGIIRALEHTLDAGAGTNWAYEWQDYSTGQTFVATNTGQYSVVVTDTLSGCVGGDTAFLLFIITDITINSVDYNLPACVGSNEGVRVELVNNGNQPMGGAAFTLSYQIDGGTIITENVVNSQQWPVDATWWYSLANNLNYNSTGETGVLMYISHDDDLRRDNDTVSSLLNVFESPEVNLGPANLKVPLPHTLDAGSGHASYLWNDNSTGQTLQVTEEGTYSVTVTSENGCRASDQITVIEGISANPYTQSNLHMNIYPNPTDDFIHVSFELQQPEDLIIEIIGMNNQLYYYDEIPSATRFEDDIDLGDISQGIYFMCIRGKNIWHVSKIIKE